MPPALRSASTSPAGKPSSSSRHTPSSTPRKVPHCTKCHRPRAGHPRSGCPYADTPTKSRKSTSSPSPDREANITDAFGSMRLDQLELDPPSDQDEERKAAIHSRRHSPSKLKPLPQPTLLSLSTNSSEIVAKLLQQDSLEGDTDQEDPPRPATKKLVQWQEDLESGTPFKFIPPRVKGQRRILMPGTLIPPTPDASLAFIPDNSNVKERPSEIPQQDSPISTTGSSVYAPSTTSEIITRPRQPLSRSMSQDERDSFVGSLSRVANATVYILPKSDVPEILASATNLGFYNRVALNHEDDSGLLVIGRDEKAVIRLFKQVAPKTAISGGTSPVSPTCSAPIPLPSPVSASASSSRRTSAFGAAAGAVVVGAVGTWVGLAFS
ncbi:hypothetical protein BDN72DRAFT_836816 [Pluteus cervinus]|uniref:Uncharacterized protein n=1 Tax=Pluteus cervinus TaxID=181527 RepID=A0ACD3B1Q6_9AGAR|nr:hypothetical protein BDN72DRAFT_836816 [Pluteus cervinus]